MTVGERIKYRRVELNLTVDELAKRLGKNRATVYRYESNDIENFPITVLEPLAQALRTTPSYLMGWEEDTNHHIMSTDFNKTFTEKLDKLMQERCINRSVLAKESGIPYTTIVEFYKKGSDNVKLSTLRKLSNYFNCSLNYLVDDEIETEANVSSEQFDINTLTKEEKEDIQRYIDFILSKRNNQ
jgi:transcriptional regulator with XRE-family HTH domain